MRHVTITLTFDVPDEVTDEDLQILEWTSLVQVQEPMDADNIKAAYATSRVSSSLSVRPAPSGFSLADHRPCAAQGSHLSTQRHTRSECTALTEGNPS